MRWEDERYVRLYTRDTATWLLLPWQSRFVLMSLLRKVDRAGLLEVGDGDGMEELVVVLGIPREVLEAGLQPLLSRAVVERRSCQFVLPNFLEAQEAKTSDKERQRKYRETARVRHTPSQPVTNGHTPSQPVTPSLAVPPVTSRDEPPNPPASSGVDPLRATSAINVPVITESAKTDLRERNVGPPAGAAERRADLREEMETAWREERGSEFSWKPRDDAASRDLLAKHTRERVLATWRRALRRPFPLCLHVGTLLQHWDTYDGKDVAERADRGRAAEADKDWARASGEPF